jgi:hypothetical protein
VQSPDLGFQRSILPLTSSKRFAALPVWLEFAIALCVQHFSFQHFSSTPNLPFPRPPISVAYFAEATKAKKASSYAKASADKTAVKKATADKTTGRPVWPPALSTAFTTKANS